MKIIREYSKFVVPPLALITTILFVTTFGISINDPVSGYCTFDNCICTDIYNNICGNYQANVFYRIYDRKYKNYDYYFTNVSVDICPKESICYAKKFGNENKIYLIYDSPDISILYILLYLFTTSLFVLIIILIVVKSELYLPESNTKEDISVEP